MSSEHDRTPKRRTVLRSLGVATGVPLTGAFAYARDRNYADESGDGIPDAKERSSAVHDRLEAVFGSQFEGLDPGRRDLLLDVRYVDGTDVFSETKAEIVSLFRDRGIYAQWLDYPETYDREAFEDDYGQHVRAILWGRDGFYRTEVESFLRDIAVQVIVVPGRTDPAYEGLVYSQWMDTLGGGRDGHVNGFSVGNRAVVADRTTQSEEARLLLHEIAHLGLCHDDDPENTGVMGTGENLDLTDHEWETLRNNLENVRDTTGYDVVFRRCLWEETFTETAGVWDPGAIPDDVPSR